MSLEFKAPMSNPNWLLKRRAMDARKMPEQGGITGGVAESILRLWATWG